MIIRRRKPLGRLPEEVGFWLERRMKLNLERSGGRREGRVCRGNEEVISESFK